jgi:hypothetical protein
MTTVVRREDVARSVAEAVTAVPGVAGLTPGPGVEVSTQFSGGKVVGVRLGGEQVEIHIRADRMPLPPIAAEAIAAARRVLAAIGDERRVLVVVDDVVADAFDRRRSDRE